jgi:hypothetical protein
MEVLRFKRSSYCCADNCVEVAFDSSGYAFVRDSKDPDENTLEFSPAAWSDFIIGIRRREFDLERKWLR